MFSSDKQNEPDASLAARLAHFGWRPHRLVDRAQIDKYHARDYDYCCPQSAVDFLSRFGGLQLETKGGVVELAPACTRQHVYGDAAEFAVGSKFAVVAWLDAWDEGFVMDSWGRVLSAHYFDFAFCASTGVEFLHYLFRDSVMPRLRLLTRGELNNRPDWWATRLAPLAVAALTEAGVHLGPGQQTETVRRVLLGTNLQIACPPPELPDRWHWCSLHTVSNDRTNGLIDASTIGAISRTLGTAVQPIATLQVTNEIVMLGDDGRVYSTVLQFARPPLFYLGESIVELMNNFCYRQPGRLLPPLERG